MTHTPGPWTYHREPTLNRFVVRANFADQTNIATSYGAGLKSYEHEANARLIAAAPELLEALKALRDHPDLYPRAETKLWDRVEAAIAKAEGNGQ